LKLQVWFEVKFEVIKKVCSQIDFYKLMAMFQEINVRESIGMAIEDLSTWRKREKRKLVMVTIQFYHRI
jgi:hypothetical protein